MVRNLYLPFLDSVRQLIPRERSIACCHSKGGWANRMVARVVTSYSFGPTSGLELTMAVQ